MTAEKSVIGIENPETFEEPVDSKEGTKWWKPWKGCQSNYVYMSFFEEKFRYVVPLTNIRQD